MNFVNITYFGVSFGVIALFLGLQYYLFFEIGGIRRIVRRIVRRIYFMNFVNITYFGVSFGVIALFLGLYIASGVGFCLTPIPLVFYDWWRTRQRNRLLARDIPRVRRTPFHDRTSRLLAGDIEQTIEPVYLFTDIFKEES